MAEVQSPNLYLQAQRLRVATLLAINPHKLAASCYCNELERSRQKKAGGPASRKQAQNALRFWKSGQFHAALLAETRKRGLA